MLFVDEHPDKAISEKMMIGFSWQVSGVCFLWLIKVGVYNGCWLAALVGGGAWASVAMCRLMRTFFWGIRCAC
ncbi:MAG: hypothetical protein Q4E06_02335 [Lautropia sp.]|nr:hypothetical protein [Lautropia sp.]